MSEARRTALYDAHKAAGARIVDFAGFAMPVQYKEGIIAEHRAVRQGVGLFDVSHMGEVEFKGPAAAAAVQHLVTSDIGKLTDGAALYTVACLPEGGIVDDLIVYRFASDHYMIVVNASNIEKDYAWFRKNSSGSVEVINRSDDYALLALQGPKAETTLAPLWKGPPLAEIPSFHARKGTIAGRAATASRTGYTGEDGFEIFCGPTDATALFAALLEVGAAPAGLGARDTLRLEARLCLYGNELSETTSPLEAGLGWVVKPDAVDFIGKPALLAQKAQGVARRLVGFVMKERGIARHGYDIYAPSGEKLGVVTSGSPSPTTGQNIGLGYVPVALSEPGQTLSIDCRGKRIAAEIVKGAFYKRGKRT